MSGYFKDASYEQLRRVLEHVPYMDREQLDIFLRWTDGHRFSGDNNETSIRYYTGE